MILKLLYQILLHNKVNRKELELPVEVAQIVIFTNLISNLRKNQVIL